MTKEEYLSMYKEEKLAELCESFEEQRDFYKKNMHEEKNRADELASYWDSVGKLFNKLQSLPAKDFIDLYYKMDAMMKHNEKLNMASIMPSGLVSVGER